MSKKRTRIVSANKVIAFAMAGRTAFLIPLAKIFITLASSAVCRTRINHRQINSWHDEFAPSLGATFLVALPATSHSRSLAAIAVTQQRINSHEHSPWLHAAVAIRYGRKQRASNKGQIMQFDREPLASTAAIPLAVAMPALGHGVWVRSQPQPGAWRTSPEVVSRG
jgi:hypothetical protein